MERKRLMTTTTNRKRGQGAYVFRSAWMRGLMTIIDGLGWALVSFLTGGRGLKGKKTVPAQPQRLLVIRLDHIGDLLFARPALEALRSCFPDATITLLTSTVCAELMRADPNIDELLIWDAPWFNRHGQHRHVYSAWKLIKTIRKMKVDLSLDLRGDLRHHIMLTLAGVPWRVGYTITGGGFLLHQPLQLRPAQHEVDRNLDALRALCQVSVPINYPPLALSRQELDKQQERWQPGKKRLIIHPAAGDPNKCWPRSVFIEIGRALLKLGYDIMLVGTSSEYYLINEIKQSFAGVESIRDLSGQTTIRELAALISTAHLFIGHDSGPAHMAVTQQIPTVMLWSATNDPVEWGPWGEQNQTLVIPASQQQQTVPMIMQMINQSTHKGLDKK